MPRALRAPDASWLQLGTRQEWITNSNDPAKALICVVSSVNLEENWARRGLEFAAVCPRGSLLRNAP